MKHDAKSVADLASRLASSERARLALRLIESLDPGVDEQVDNAWLAEAEQRLEDHDRTGKPALNADEVLARIERQL
jgi:putative addiction module component (TIGR02574 family)